MRRTYRTLAATAALAVLVPATGAQADPEHDAAELSQTIEVAWLMPGPFEGWATFPQTYLPDGVPACGEGAVQVDLYRYGTQEMRDLVHELTSGGVLASPADDARVAAGRVYRFVELEPCGPLGPGTPTDPGDPADPDDPADPGDPTGPGVPGPVSDAGDVDGARGTLPPADAPRALPARAHTAVPTYAG